MEKIEFDNEDRRQYISLLQDNINRMAANSSSCKTWLVSIVSALLAVQAALKEMACILMMASVFLILLFYLLDSYYLGLEKRFIKLEEILLDKIKTKNDYHSDMYNLNPQKIGGNVKFTLKSMGSFSTWPFYCFLFLCIFTIYLYTKYWLK